MIKNRELVRMRMASQGVARLRWGSVEEVVGGMGAVQAQDWAGAKWAVGMRAGAATEAGVDGAFQEGRILRTHVLRPTWHFVLPADIGWMLALTAPRVRNFCLPYHRKLGIDAGVLSRSRKVMEKELRDGVSLTRKELTDLFKKAKIDTGDIRMNYLLIDAELEGLICSGGRRGKQFTYALLEERAPKRLVLDGDEALAELTRRYFASRGPATAADFAWWAGMTLGMARKGLELVGSVLREEGGYYYDKLAIEVASRMKEVLLLPAFDELMVGYEDRSAMLPAEYEEKTFHGLRPLVVVRGKVVGLWTREVKKNVSILEFLRLEKWSKTTQSIVSKEGKRYRDFYRC